MKYYKYEDPYVGEGLYADPTGVVGTTYVETDDGYALRMITVFDDQYLSSNQLYPPAIGMYLSEGYVDYDAQEEVMPIDADEFERIWEHHLADRLPKWRSVRSRYAIGAEVIGTIVCFYPQGVIVDLGDEAVGLADYDACRASTTPGHMYPGHRVSGKIGGHDDRNQWLEIVEPRVGERRPPR